MSVLVPVSHCLGYCGLVIVPQVWKSFASCLVFVPQDCFGNSGSFVVPYKFLIVCSSSMKNVMGNLIGIALGLLIALGSMAIFMILIFPIQEHGISFHFYESSLISLINVLQFLAYNKFFTSLSGLFTGTSFLGCDFKRYCIFVFFSNISLLLYRNATNFWMLTVSCYFAEFVDQLE